MRIFSRIKNIWNNLFRKKQLALPSGRGEIEKKFKENIELEKEICKIQNDDKYIETLNYRQIMQLNKYCREKNEELRISINEKVIQIEIIKKKILASQETLKGNNEA